MTMTMSELHGPLLRHGFSSAHPFMECIAFDIVVHVIWCILHMSWRKHDHGH